jgi:hypothetical protein
MTQNAILNVAVGGRYPAGQDRLRLSLMNLTDWPKWDVRLFWGGCWPGCPHASVPYGFKVDAFDHARKSRYRKALWLDAQVIAAKPLLPLWALLDARPVLLLEDPAWNLGEWTSDAALALFGTTRDAAMNLPLCYAKVIGINLESQEGLAFLTRWRELRDLGGFNGPWTADGEHGSFDTRFRGHRHDQSCASWLAHELGIPMVPMVDILSRDPSAESIFLLRDL